MAGFFSFLFLVALGLAIWRVPYLRRRPRVHDAEGRCVFPTTAADLSGWIAGVAIPVGLILLAATSIRVVPVGQARPVRPSGW